MGEEIEQYYFELDFALSLCALASSGRLNLYDKVNTRRGFQYLRFLSQVKFDIPLLHKREDRDLTEQEKEKVEKKLEQAINTAFARIGRRTEFDYAAEGLNVGPSILRYEESAGNKRQQGQRTMLKIYGHYPSKPRR